MEVARGDLRCLRNLPFRLRPLHPPLPRHLAQEEARALYCTRQGMLDSGAMLTHCPKAGAASIYLLFPTCALSASFSAFNSFIASIIGAISE